MCPERQRRLARCKEKSEECVRSEDGKKGKEKRKGKIR
jgi:hypothetical protein